MIAYLTGALFKKGTQSIIIDNAGVGYEVIVPLSTFYALPDENAKVGLHIHTHVREDALVLFGFHTPLEKGLFLMLISVSGIGPKLATNILSGIGPEELLDAISRGDSARLQSIPGVGKKTAERISLELRDKAAKTKLDFQPSPVQLVTGVEKRLYEDAVSALVNLGYSAKLSRDAVDRAKGSAQAGSLESLIKEALRLII